MSVIFWTLTWSDFRKCLLIVPALTPEMDRNRLAYWKWWGCFKLDSDHESTKLQRVANLLPYYLQMLQLLRSQPFCTANTHWKLTFVPWNKSTHPLSYFSSSHRSRALQLISVHLHWLMVRIWVTDGSWFLSVCIPEKVVAVPIGCLRNAIFLLAQRLCWHAIGTFGRCVLLSIYWYAHLSCKWEVNRDTDDFFMWKTLKYMLLVLYVLLWFWITF